MLLTESASGLAQIVGGHFHIDPVTDTDPNEILAHFTRDVGEHLVSVWQGHTKHRTRQNLRHSAVQLNWFFFGHFVTLLKSSAIASD